MITENVMRQLVKWSVQDILVPVKYLEFYGFNHRSGSSLAVCKEVSQEQFETLCQRASFLPPANDPSLLLHDDFHAKKTKELIKTGFQFRRSSHQAPENREFYYLFYHIQNGRYQIYLEYLDSLLSEVAIHVHGAEP